jgi:hypothetical protein
MTSSIQSIDPMSAFQPPDWPTEARIERGPRPNKASAGYRKPWRGLLAIPPGFRGPVKVDPSTFSGHPSVHAVEWKTKMVTVIRSKLRAAASFKNQWTTPT